jgi:hypothetical protein
VLSAVSGDIPDELRDAWGKLLAGGDARKIRKHLPDLQRSVLAIRGLETSLKDAFQGIEPEAVDPNKRSEVRTTLVSSLQSHSLVMGGVLRVFSRLSADAQGAMQKVLGWIAEHLVGMLTAFAGHLGIQNWSVAAQLASFPPGASFTISVTFA